ncbi:glycosyltransferase [Cohnella hongkongensis]|uniref:Glycosyltransferase n=1 Tax=Cohnella hongkongensis TaxID=178337 RepID=A0ABV9FCL4_9BACL
MKALFYKALYKSALPFKKLLVLIIPQAIRKRIKKIIIDKGYQDELKSVSTLPSASSFGHFNGINLIGYSRAEMGIGESCRIAAKSLETTRIEYAVLNFIGTNSAKMSDTTWEHKETRAPEYNVNIFHLNAEQMFEVYTHFGAGLFEGRYNIGFWHWELEDFPEEWLDGFNFVNEVWVPSSFVSNAISMKSPVPVVRIPHAIEVKIEHKRNRAYYGLPEDAFLFLTMYDMNSFQERKNPMGSIQSFKQMFAPDDMSVGLVVKINNASANRQDFKAIEQSIKGYSNIYVINKTLSRNDTNALLAVSDSFISLHRSEGFGLGLAEAMYLGKPAIGTNWSSTTDFMNSQNSCPVKYQLVSVGDDYGPYQAYQRWAEPDISHAAKYMKRLVEDSVYYKQIAVEGERYIKSELSPYAVGKLIEKRMRYIQRHFGG